MGTHVDIVAEKADDFRRARRELREAIREAHTSGQPLSAIGEAAGLSKQRIHQIVGKADAKKRGGRKKAGG
jgi:hypothetical protein